MTPAQLTLVTPEPTQTQTIAASRRDRYLDLLRVLAIGQVMLIHVVDLPWYPATFPAMGIMFAIGASLLAGSLDRSRHQPMPVVRKRVVRLLAPMWAMGAILVPLMIALGWTNTGNGKPLDATSMLTWILPITQPPASDLGYDWALPLWFLCVYLWLVVLSPALLWLFRRWPKRMLAAPLAVLVLNTMGLAPLSGDVGDVVTDLATFGTCWLLGFAHHDGLLTRMRLLVALAVGAALYGIGIGCAYAFPSLERGPLPAETPIAYGFLSTGLVLVLLRLHPHLRGRLGAHRLLTNLVTAVNHRAMTVYLWGNACISLAFFLLDIADEQTWWPQGLPESAWPSMALALTIVLLTMCAVCLGWVEDKAAGRPARLNPWPSRAAATAHPARPRRRQADRSPGIPGRPPYEMRSQLTYFS